MFRGFLAQGPCIGVAFFETRFDVLQARALREAFAAGGFLGSAAWSLESVALSLRCGLAGQRVDDFCRLVVIVGDSVFG